MTPLWLLPWVEVRFRIVNVDSWPTSWTCPPRPHSHLNGTRRLPGHTCNGGNNRPTKIGS